MKTTNEKLIIIFKPDQIIEAIPLENSLPNFLVRLNGSS